jgi:hypothetical protein
VIQGSLPAPAIVQERLVPPEIRVYRIHQRCFAYQLVAEALDYRATADCVIRPVAEADLPDGFTARLATLMDCLQMDFGAADFKACPRTGQWQFLEINDGPMFAAFDAVSGGRVTEALVDFPIGGFSPPEGRLARGFKPPAFSRFLFQSAVKSAESF